MSALRRSKTRCPERETTREHRYRWQLCLGLHSFQTPKLRFNRAQFASIASHDTRRFPRIKLSHLSLFIRETRVSRCPLCTAVFRAIRNTRGETPSVLATVGENSITREQSCANIEFLAAAANATDNRLSPGFGSGRNWKTRPGRDVN